MSVRTTLIATVFVLAASGTLVADDPAPPPSDLRLVLPPLVHAVAGVETNIYFDNICLAINSRNYAFDVDGTLGEQQAERWTANPGDRHVGDHTLTITIRDQENRIRGKATTIVRVVEPQAGKDKPLSLLCIGDSLTHASVYPKSILDSCQPAGNPRLKLVGSHWLGDASDPVRHEGYGGWTAERFATHYSTTARTGDYSKRGSPFLYPGSDGKPQLDFKQYCRDVNGGQMPDLVTIFLGPNDVYSLQDDTLEAGIDKILKYYDQLLAMVRKDSPSTRIGVMLPVPPAASQDAFGANYTNGQTRWQYKRNTHRLVERMIQAYGKRTDENIDLIATCTNLDCEHNYPSAQAFVNQRSTEKIVRLNNGVHPAGPGYQQIGDAVYGWLKSTAK